MTPALTPDQARALFAAEVDGAWLARLTSTPDGRALLDAALAILVEADRRDAADAASLLLAGARRASKASAPFALRRTRPGPALRVPAGTRVQSPDGVAFALDADVAFAEGEVGVWKDTTGSAELPGHVGTFPAGSIDRFAPALPGLSGEGTSLVVAFGAGVRFVRLLTNLAVPHPFRATMKGLYVEIVASDEPRNVGRLVQIGAVNNGASPTAPEAPEGAGAFSPAYPVGAAETLNWTSGVHAYEWRVRQWAELGLEVKNTADATLGQGPSLEALALDRGIEPGEAEPEAALRARLALGPQAPSPLGLLRKLVQALAASSGDLPDLQVYEPYATAPDPAVDPFAQTFPAWGGFLAGMHCAGMPMTSTPQAMAERRAGGVTVPGAKNPGLSIPGARVEARVLVRWLLDGAAGESASRPVRVALWRAAQAAKAPGVRVVLYHPPQHGYPP
ncbi:MAG TPA: hypothetical protein VFS43_38435 [Polyangiaceae bacterium]|nr:hypothetical protein [Polyangiaceae bacterium]